MIKSMASVRWWLWLAIFVALATGSLRAAEVIPAPPTRYFNDYALTVSPATADKLNGELENFERQTSNQLRVVIYPKMQSDSDVADYCQRVARSWKIGEKEQRNGAILFVFIQDHKDNIQVGYGLEGALPDATCEDILADKVRPRFKAGDFDGGLTAGVEAMMAATKGEYKGSGKTEYEKQHPDNGANTGGGGGLSIGTIFFLIILFFIISRFFRRGGGGFGGGGLAGPILFGGLGGGGWLRRGWWRLRRRGGGGSSGGGGFSSGGGGDFGGGWSQQRLVNGPGDLLLPCKPNNSSRRSTTRASTPPSPRPSARPAGKFASTSVTMPWRTPCPPRASGSPSLDMHKDRRAQRRAHLPRPRGAQVRRGRRRRHPRQMRRGRVLEIHRRHDHASAAQGGPLHRGHRRSRRRDRPGTGDPLPPACRARDPTNYPTWWKKIDDARAPDPLRCGFHP